MMNHKKCFLAHYKQDWCANKNRFRKNLKRLLMNCLNAKTVAVLRAGQLKWWYHLASPHDVWRNILHCLLYNENKSSLYHVIMRFYKLEMPSRN